VSAKQSIDDPQGPIASLRKIVIVGHDHQSFLALAGQAEKQVHNRVAGFGRNRLQLSAKMMSIIVIHASRRAFAAGLRRKVT
jgi:hypothetical protein